jgi:hypothetical protein
VLHALWTASFFGGSSFAELNALVEETRKDLSSWNLERVAQRVGSSLTALVLVTLIGAMFAVAPVFLGLIAIVAGSLWPSWARDFVHEFRKRLILGDDELSSVESTHKKQDGGIVFPLFHEKRIEAKTALQGAQESVNMDDFYYYINQKGEKQWYRVGKSPFAKVEKPLKEKTNISDIVASWFRVQ